MSGLSGCWSGRYDYANPAQGAPVSFDATLEEFAGLISGNIVEPNTFRPDLSDTLLAVISGLRTGNGVRFVKTYTDFDDADHPHYSGQINAAATRITGTWHFPSAPQIRGTFLLARTVNMAAKRVTKTASAKAGKTLEFVEKP